MNNTIDIYIEAILFHKAEAIKKKDLAEILSVSDEEIEAGLSALSERLEGRGVRLLKNGDSVMLGTTPVTAVVIEKLIKDELDKDLGKAGLETLSIVLYQAPVSRGDIDYIRGVNSSYILRNMVMRGLIERTNDPKKRSATYAPTFELLSYLGITDVSELPEYAAVQKEMSGLLEKDLEEKEKGEENKDDALDNFSDEADVSELPLEEDESTHDETVSL